MCYLIRTDLKKLLANYDMELKDFCKIVGINYMTLYQIDKSESIRLSTMNKIISTLGCTIHDYILVEDKYKRPNKAISRKGNTYVVNIKDVYEASGLNTRSFSEIIGENIDTTRKLIKGVVKEIKIKTIEKLITEFYCTLDDIFKLKEE